MIITHINDKDTMLSVKARINEAFDEVAKIEQLAVNIDAKVDRVDGTATDLTVANTITLNNDTISSWSQINTLGSTGEKPIVIDETGKISVLTDSVTIGTRDGNLTVVDGGIGASKLSPNAVTSSAIASGAVTVDKILNGSVTKAKIENLADMKVLGNVSGTPSAPTEVAVSNDPTMASNSAITLVTQQSVKSYVDGRTATSYFRALDQQNPGVGAQTYTYDAWSTRKLGTQPYVGVSWASLNDSNQIYLSAGTYRIEASASSHKLNNDAGTLYTRLRIRDVSSGTTLLRGMEQGILGTSNLDGQSASVCTVSGNFTLFSGKTIELQQYAKSHYLLGGIPMNDGEPEIYADIEIWKIA